MAKFAVPMRMVMTGDVVVEADTKDEAEEKVRSPINPAVREKLERDVDWKLSEYEADLTWGINRVETAS